MSFKNIILVFVLVCLTNDFAVATPSSNAQEIATLQAEFLAINSTTIITSLQSQAYASAVQNITDQLNSLTSLSDSDLAAATNLRDLIISDFSLQPYLSNTVLDNDTVSDNLNTLLDILSVPSQISSDAAATAASLLALLSSKTTAPSANTVFVIADAILSTSSQTADTVNNLVSSIEQAALAASMGTCNTSSFSFSGTLNGGSYSALTLPSNLSSVSLQSGFALNIPEGDCSLISVFQISTNIYAAQTTGTTVVGELVIVSFGDATTGIPVSVSNSPKLITVSINLSGSTNAADDSVVCSFWNVHSNTWDIFGCTKNASSAGSTLVCDCNHATVFTGTQVQSNNIYSGSFSSPGTGAPVTAEVDASKNCFIYNSTLSSTAVGFLANTVNNVSVCCTTRGFVDSFNCSFPHCNDSPTTATENFVFGTTNPSDGDICFSDCYILNNNPHAVLFYQTRLSGYSFQPLSSAPASYRDAYVIESDNDDTIAAAFTIIPGTRRRSAGQRRTPTQYACYSKGTYSASDYSAGCSVQGCGSAIVKYDYYFDTSSIFCYADCYSQ